MMTTSSRSRKPGLKVPKIRAIDIKRPKVDDQHTPYDGKTPFVGAKVSGNY